MATYKTVACDLDGIVVNLLPVWRAAFARKYPHREFGFDGTNWDFVHRLPVKDKVAHRDILNDKDLYINAPHFEGAVEGVTKLKKLNNCELVFLSSPCGPEAFAGKVEWLHLYWPGIPYILTRRKDLVMFDILIDDNPLNVLECKAARLGEAYFTLRHSYIEEHKHVYDGVADNWAELAEMVEREVNDENSRGI